MREQQEQKHRGVEIGQGQRITSPMWLGSRVCGGWSHRGCQIIGWRHVSHLLPSETQDNSKSLYLAFKPLHHLVPIFPDSLPTSHVPGIPDTWNYLSMLECMKIFASVSWYLLFPFPTSLSDTCVLRGLAGPQDYSCPLPPQLPLSPSVRDLRLHSGSYLSASILRSQASKGYGLSHMLSLTG